MGGWGVEGVKTTEKKTHWPRLTCPDPPLYSTPSPPTLNRRYILGEADKEASQSTGVWQQETPSTPPATLFSGSKFAKN
jgi:hypothetical protein